MRRILLFWSTGKDSAWALHTLRQEKDTEVIALLTTYNETFSRVAMHGTRLELARAQADAAGLPLITVPLPHPCSNELYEARIREALSHSATDWTHVAFGDIFLEDIRAYREKLLTGTGLQALFPLWSAPQHSRQLAERMISGGLKALVVTIDPRLLPREFLGCAWDEKILSQLPAGVDPCGEHGEFHTFCYDGPMFAAPIRVNRNDCVLRDGFWFQDLTAVTG